MRASNIKTYQPYIMMLCVYALFIAMAFIRDGAVEISEGLRAIVVSPSVIITDYIFVGGFGAAMVNSALVGIFGVTVLACIGVKPTGSTIMSLWVLTGFALFGNNLFNMLPITFGVFLYSRYQGEPFKNFTLAALLSTTLSPVVSGIAFSEIRIQEAGFFVGFDMAFLEHPELRIAFGVLFGIFSGFLFPAVSAFTMRVHSGYDLYNMGFAGGVISTFLICLFSGLGIEMTPNLEWSSGDNLFLAILLCIIFIGLITCGLVMGGKNAIKEFPKLMKTSGRLVSDYYIQFGYSVYINMGVTGAISTAILLILGCDLNGPTIGGIFTIIGFSAFGKHPRNILPLMIGAIISANINLWDPTSPTNTLAILFSTGLAPIAGHFGWVWGVIAGFIHVSMIIHISGLNSGFNLYNNGYAAGIVAMLLIPVITALSKNKGDD